MLIMQSPCRDVSRWVTGKTRGTVLKVLCWQKLSPAQLSCCLCWPCLAAQARAQHCPLLPGITSASAMEAAGTFQMVIWKAKCEHSYYQVHKLGSAARVRPSSSHLSSLQHHYPLSVLKLSFRPLPRVLNRVIYSNYRLLPTEPHETGKK